MDFPFLLIVLLALPIATAAVILGVSAARRSRRGSPDAPAQADAHRLQSDTAGVQDAADHPSAGPPQVASGRARRAASAPRQTGE